MASDTTTKVALSFTGGKDSTLVLHLLQLQSAALLGPDAARLRSLIPEPLTTFRNHSVECLVTFVPKGALRPFKAHPLALVSAQAAAVNLPHKVCEVGEPYLESYQGHIRAIREEYGVDFLATGDIEDVCSGFMHKAVAGTGVQLLKPLWQLPRTCLLDLTWQLGLRPVISCTHIPKFATGSAPLLHQCRALLLPSDPAPLDALNNGAPAPAAAPAPPPTAAAPPTVPAATTSATAPAAAPAVPAAAGATAATSPDATATATSPLLTILDAAPLLAKSAPPSQPPLAGAAAPPCNITPPAQQQRQQQQQCPRVPAGTGPTALQQAAPPAAAGSEADPAATPGQAATCEIAEWLVGAELNPRVHELLLRPLGSLGVDAGGEYGEYHTMVLDGPLFERAVRVEAARKVEEEYCFLEVRGVQLVAK